MKGTRKLLISSLLMIVTCCLLFTATTFAWFSDSVSSNNNIIKAGNLDVELYYSHDANAQYKLVEENTSILNNEALWEPGYTQVVYFEVKNAGSLALKYDFNFSVILEETAINVYGDEFALSDYLVYGGELTDQKSELVTRAEALALAKNELESSNSLVSKGELLPGESHFGYLVIAMPTTVGNEANTKPGTSAPFVQIGFDLIATQFTYEEDSFDDQYDKDAEAEKVLPTANVVKNSTLTVLTEQNTLSGFRPSALPKSLEVQYTFNATETLEEAQNNDFRYWHADFVVSFDKPVAAGTVGLAGQYNTWSPLWLAFENTGKYNIDIAAGQEIRLLWDAEKAIINYEEICKNVKSFQCGAYDIDNALAGTTMKVELRIYETVDKNATGTKNTETGEYLVLGEYYHTFNDEVYGEAELAAALAEGGLVKLGSDIVTAAEVAADGKVLNYLTVAAGNNVVLDLNGHNISVENTATEKGNHSLIQVKGSLEITGNGTISYTDKGLNMGWGGLSAVISVEGGSLVLGSGVELVHNGGTDMAYAVDVNSTLGASSLEINGATLKSSYIAVRLFNNNKTAEAKVVLNSGLVDGARRDLWVQNPSAAAVDANGVVEIAAGYNYNVTVQDADSFYGRIYDFN